MSPGAVKGAFQKIHTTTPSPALDRTSCHIDGPNVYIFLEGVVGGLRGLGGRGGGIWSPHSTRNGSTPPWKRGANQSWASGVHGPLLSDG